MVVLLQASEVIDLVSIENITVFGIMLFVMVLLILDREKLAKKTDLEHERLREAIKHAQDELRSEFKETNQDLKQITEKYHIFTVQVFEKLKNILNLKER
tara:strand:+ start:469 stop:768 length:300 start_codon:yes stop_codon:yes gene_type:complete